MLCLAGIICMGLLAIELTMNRFQVLPLLFPGMFSVRERRFYFFDYLVSNVAEANHLRRQAKMLCRMTLCVVLSYLWQHCVMDTTQQVGREFPRKECNDGKDCYASELHFMTLLSRQHEPVDCSGEHKDFPSRMVVSCIRLVEPSAAGWLMHLAISHSITQLNFKAFEILVWLTGNSANMRRLFGVFPRLVISLGAFVGVCLFFGGVVSDFAASWLSFVTIISIPLFFHSVYRSSKVLHTLYVEEAARVQSSIEQHLSAALSECCDPEQQEDEGCKGNNISSRARALLKFSGIPSMLPAMVKSFSSPSSPRTTDAAPAPSSSSRQASSALDASLAPVVADVPAVVDAAAAAAMGPDDVFSNSDNNKINTFVPLH
mmetsp:Transcript_6466/g.15338  ORF Transcript_6466/g.15338 Transcript_6466/m.15338 type:complete len:374 (+) Transcript_6466:87-1208(+)